MTDLHISHVDLDDDDTTSPEARGVAAMMFTIDTIRTLSRVSPTCSAYNTEDEAILSFAASVMINIIMKHSPKDEEVYYAQRIASIMIDAVNEAKKHAKKKGER